MSKPAAAVSYKDDCDKQKKFTEQTTAIISTNSQNSLLTYSGGSADDPKSTLRSMISQKGTVITCTVCGKTKDKETDKQAIIHMERHIESLHIEGLSYDCARCDKTFR